MIRTAIAGAAALALAWFAAGCGGSTPPAADPGANRKPPPPKGNGPVIIEVADAPRVVLEAEAATNVQPHFKVVDDSEASGGKCLTVPSKGCSGALHQHIAPEGDPERTRGSAELAFTVEKDGEYILWIRKWWCCSCGDSFSLQLDEGKPFVFGNDGTTTLHWSWLAHQEAGEVRKFKLAAGAHKLIFRNRGESGFRIDQVLFTADPKYVPQGKEQPPAAPAAPKAPAAG
jgi:hypothetical protein